MEDGSTGKESLFLFGQWKDHYTGRELREEGENLSSEVKGEWSLA